MKQSTQLRIYAVILILGGIAMIVSGLIPPPALVDGETLSFEELDTTNAYYIEDLAVSWEYGYTTGGDNDGSYYLAYFADKNDQLCAVSVYFDNNKEWKETAAAHDFEEADMLMGGCFKVKKISSVSESMKRYYEECLADVMEISVDYLGTDNLKDTGLHFDFVCNEKDEYAEASSKSAFFIGAVALIALAALLLFLSKKIKEKAEAAARAQAEQMRFDPFTGAPINPQQPYGTPAQTEDRDNYQGPEF